MFVEVSGEFLLEDLLVLLALGGGTNDNGIVLDGSTTLVIPDLTALDRAPSAEDDDDDDEGAAVRIFAPAGGTWGVGGILASDARCHRSVDTNRVSETGLLCDVGGSVIVAEPPAES